jgi:hypothetical protein
MPLPALVHLSQSRWNSDTVTPLPLQGAVPSGFTIHDFRIDRHAGRCPGARRRRSPAPARSASPVTAGAARCVDAAPPPRVAGPSASTRTRTSYAPPAAARPPAASRRATGDGGRWWNAPLPGWSPMAAGGCPTAASNATICGGRSGSLRSTSVGSWHLALPVGTRAGSWLDTNARDALLPANHLPANHRTTA